MTKKNIINLNHSSFLLLAIFTIFSCSSMRALEQETFTNIVDDYVKDFYHLKEGGEIEALLVYISEEDKSLQLTIQDYPIKTLFSDIRKKHSSDSLVTFGVYQNIPIQLIQNRYSANFLEKVLTNDSTLVSRAKHAPQYLLLDGDKIEFDSGLMEYEPFLISKYSLRENVKEMRLADGRILRKKIDKD
jgi:hypothetical protein